MKNIATSMAGRSAAKRLGRAIPNPIMRKVVVLAATALAPMVLRKVQARMQARRSARLGGASGGTPALSEA